MTNTLTLNEHEFCSHTVAEIDLGTCQRLKVSLTFRNGDWKQPVSVSFFDPDEMALVNIPAGLWPLIAERINADWEQ